MKANERRVAIGGLMRCCLRSIADSEEETEVGSTMVCRWCTAGAMRVEEDGVWHWDHPAGPYTEETE